MRRRIPLILAILSAILFAVWRFHYHGADPRLIFNPPPLPAPTPAALFESAEIDVSDMPFREAIEQLAARYGCSIEIDTAELSAAQVALDQPVTLKIGGVSLYSVVNQLVRQLRAMAVTATIRGSELHITTIDDWRKNTSFHETRLYPHDPAPAYDEEATLLQNLASLGNWSYESWGEAGGLLTAPSEVHEGLTWLLHRVEANEPAQSFEPMFADGPFAIGNRRVRRALETPIDLDLNGMTLSEAATVIGEIAGIPVVVEWPYVDMLGQSYDPYFLRGRFRGERLSVVLQLVLAEHGLDFYVADEALVLSRHSYVKDLSFDAVYPVEDLARWFEQGDTAVSMDPIFEEASVRTFLRGPSVGMAGRTTIYRDAIIQSKGMLPVSLTGAGHREFAERLDGLRRALFPFIESARQEQSPSRQESMLASTAILEADEPIDRFAERLSRDFGINVWVSPAASLPPDNHVRGRPPQGSLGESITSLLEPLDLMAIPSHETLIITTPGGAPDYFVGEWYRLRFLIGRYVDESRLTRVFDEWMAEANGYSVSRHDPRIIGDVVYLTNPPGVHRDLRRLIQTLNNGIDQPLFIGPPASDIDPYVEQLVAYPVTSLNRATDNRDGRFEHELEESLTIAVLARHQVGFGWPTLLGDYLFAYLPRELHTPLERAINSLTDSFEHPAAAELPWRIVFESDGESVGGNWQVVAYDIRGLTTGLPESAVQDLPDLLHRACQISATDAESDNIVSVPGLLTVESDSAMHQDLRHAIERLATNAALAKALRRPNLAEKGLFTDVRPDEVLASSLLDTLLSTADPIERRIAAILLQSRGLATDSLGPRLSEALKLAETESDDELIRSVCDVISGRRVDGEQALPLLNRIARQSLDNQTLKHVTDALARFDQAGAYALLDLLDEVQAQPDKYGERIVTIERSLEYCVFKILESVRPSPPYFDELTLALLRRIEQSTLTITYIVNANDPYASYPWFSRMTPEHRAALREFLVEQGVIANE